MYLQVLARCCGGPPPEVPSSAVFFGSPLPFFVIDATNPVPPLPFCLPHALFTGAGKVLRWEVPSTAVFFDHSTTIRVDSGVSEGDTVGTNYGMYMSTEQPSSK
jgi:hypothetical protein